MGRRIETALLSVLLLAVVALAGLQVVLRNFFSYALFWADDLIRLAVLWIAVVGAVAASREGRHLAIGVVQRYFPKSWHKPSSIVSSAFAFAITVLLAWHAYRFVYDAYRFEDEVLGGWPAWAFQSVMPVGFTLMALQFLMHAIRTLRGR